jgi:hypothetical protein
MDLEVEIEGVTDLRLEKEIKRRIRKACKDTPRPGEWTVLMSPSERRGEWDLLVRGPFGSDIASFTQDAAQLPALVAERLRICLTAAVPA